jgi:hypothetical protein
MKNRYWQPPQNKNARIRSRICRNGKQRTETFQRDDDTTRIAATTDKRSNSTALFIDFPDGDKVKLTGHEARTLYRVLQQHFDFTDKSL